MIASKLILLFCLYLLLLLDYSLGQKPLIAQDGNKELFKAALDFGATYRGELGLLASLWKQLLIQLVHAKQNVGLGKVQLTRFNNSATTEEVGLVIPASYADKVSELVAIRTEDIGATQQYIDELEILKNEIALTMIVEMDELKRQFKEKNVREKVKEAKENGLTDEDIKEILFAEFIESEGLSLIGAGASVAEALLSSFLNGMKSILSNSKEPSIIQYGNVIGCLPFRNCVGEGGDDGGNNNGAGGDQPPGGGGGVPPSGAAGGDKPPDGGGGDSPNHLPDDKIEDDDDEEIYFVIRLDVDEFFETFRESLPESFRENPKPSPVDPQKNGDSSPEDFEQFRVILPEALETWLFHLNDPPSRREENPVAYPYKGEKPADDKRFYPYHSRRNINEANRRVNVVAERRRAQLQTFEDEIQLLQSNRANGYFEDQSIRNPDYNLNDTEKAGILNLRVAQIETSLVNARQLLSDLNESRIMFKRNYYQARDCALYYGHRSGWDASAVPWTELDFPMPPPNLPEFRDDDDDNVYGRRDNLWYLISRAHLLRMIPIGQHLQFAFDNLRTEIDQLNLILETDKTRLSVYNMKPTPEDDDTS